MVKSSTAQRRIAAHWLFIPQTHPQSHQSPQPSQLQQPQRLLKGAIVTVDSEGTVTDISSCENVDSVAGVEHYSGVLIPSMVNAHCHLELSYLVGKIPSGGGFAAFGSAIGAVRESVPQEQRLRTAEFYDARMWSEGVGAVGDVCNGNSTFAIKQKSRIAYHSFVELFGLRAESLEPVANTAASAQTYGIPYNITPHSTYSLNNMAWAAAIGQTLSDVPLSIHFMESEGERELYQRRGEMWEWYKRCGFETDFLDYGSPAERIVRTIPAERKVMLIHNTFVNREEAQMLVNHFGDNLTWVLCPRSNRYITGALPPVDMLLEVGGRIAIGTDSLASNSELSLIEELKYFDNIPLTTLLDWVTSNGATALALGSAFGDTLGSALGGISFGGEIKIGAKCGLVLLSDFDTSTMKLTKNSKTTRIL